MNDNLQNYDQIIDGLEIKNNKDLVFRKLAKRTEHLSLLLEELRPSVNDFESEAILCEAIAVVESNLGILRCWRSIGGEVTADMAAKAIKKTNRHYDLVKEYLKRQQNVKKECQQ